MNDTTPPEETPEPAWSPVRPVRRDGAPPHASTTPRVVTSLPAGFGAQDWPERDLLAEAQIKGVAVWFCVVAVIQVLVAIVFGLAVTANNRDMLNPAAVVEFAGSSQLSLVVPAVVLWFALAVHNVERRRFLALPVLIVGGMGAIMLWGDAEQGVRVAFSLGACGGLSFLLGYALWSYGSIARLVTAGWALLALYPAGRLFADGSPMWGLYAAVVPGVVLFTLFFPRTGRVFDDAYTTRAERDGRPVPIYASVPLWVLVAWLGVPVLAFLQLLR